MMFKRQTKMHVHGVKLFKNCRQNRLIMTHGKALDVNLFKWVITTYCILYWMLLHSSMANVSTTTRLVSSCPTYNKSITAKSICSSELLLDSFDTTWVVSNLQSLIDPLWKFIAILFPTTNFASQEVINTFSKLGQRHLQTHWEDILPSRNLTICAPNHDAKWCPQKRLKDEMVFFTL